MEGWNPQTDPLESYAQCHFSSPPRYTYYVKGTKETFKSLETDHKKAYQKHLENKAPRNKPKAIQQTVKRYRSS
jgi:hypothetical protein